MNISIDSTSTNRDNSKKKKEYRGNLIIRQELSNYGPVCNIMCGIIYFSLLLGTFLGFGIPILVTALNIQEIILDYTYCEESKCTLQFVLNKPIKPPSYLYYEIHNFYMNQRDFVKSKIVKQLRGEVHVDSTKNSNCEGAIYMYEMFDNDSSKYKTFTGEPLEANDYANPCGLIAKSMFNDTGFKLISEIDGEIFEIIETDITSKYDLKYNFKSIKNASKVQWIDITNEHFIVWMQMEPFEVFRKLWGRIEKNLPIGKYRIELDNNWNVTKFKGKKKLVLTGSSKIGTGKFYGIVLIGGAVYCLLMVIILVMCKCSRYGKKKYKLNELKWE